MLYKRLCETVQDYGRYIPKNEDIYSHLTKDKDYYTSIYYYTEDHVKKATEIIEIDGKKRPRGISGITDVKTDKLVWDFDSDDPEVSKKDTVALINKLVDLGVEEEAIQICFSGSKGFAVEIQTNQEFSPDEFKAVTKDLAKGLSTYDSVISNPSRMFRLPKTKHQKSKLYKLPLYFDELKEMSVFQIKNAAKKKPAENDEVMGSWIPTAYSFAVPKQIVEEKPELSLVSDSDVSVRVDYNRNPYKLIPWKLAIQQGIFPAGTRNDALMILGATLKSKGLDRNDCYYALKSASDKQSKLFGQDKYSKEEIWKNVITPIYSALWNGATYSTANFPEKLREFYLVSGIPEINDQTTSGGLVGIDDVFSKFSRYAENIEENTIKTGITELDGFCRIMTGMLVGWLGCPGSGKTASMLQILGSLSDRGEQSIFFSLDMSDNQVYEKLARKCTDYSENEIMRAFENDQKFMKKEIRENVKKAYKNVQFNFQSGATVDDMKQQVVEHEQRTGKKVRLVVVDYLEKIKGGNSDPSVAAGEQASKLQDMAKELEVAVIVLLQPQKLAGEPDSPIKSYRRIKGASKIEQDCRIIVSQWRPGYSAETFENDRFITYSVLKNTMGSLGTLDCYWNGEKGRVRDIDDNGRQELKDFLKQKEALDKLNNEWL